MAAGHKSRNNDDTNMVLLYGMGAILNQIPDIYPRIVRSREMEQIGIRDEAVALKLLTGLQVPKYGVY